MSKRKALKLLRNVYLVVVFTILLGGSIFIVKTHSCAYQSVKTCLSENELVQVLYEFNEQDRQDAQELTDEMVHIIGKDTAYFSVRYKEMEIKVEAGVFDSMRNGYFLGDKNPEIIGKIVTSGLYHVNYHEVIHALQYVKIMELLQSKGLSRENASAEAWDIILWANSKRAGEYRRIIELVPNWEGCWHQIRNELNPNRARAVCIRWEPYKNDPDIYEKGIPAWGSDLLLDWTENVDYIYKRIHK